jgi:hypothetical protein
VHGQTGHKSENCTQKTAKNNDDIQTHKAAACQAELLNDIDKLQVNSREGN